MRGSARLLYSRRKAVSKATEDTIGYSDANAVGFVSGVANVGCGALRYGFARRLPEGGRILELGCGSGRDSLAFLKAGFGVDAVDGSARWPIPRASLPACLFTCSFCQLRARRPL